MKNQKSKKKQTVAPKVAVRRPLKLKTRILAGDNPGRLASNHSSTIR